MKGDLQTIALVFAAAIIGGIWLLGAQSKIPEIHPSSVKWTN